MSSDRISDQRLLELVDIFRDHQQGALRLDSDTSLALRELIRLRAENERLTKDLAHWKDCHGVTADKLAEAESQLAALRRPVAQSENVEAIRAYYLNGRTENWHQSGEHVQTLLSALDQAQRERQQLIANHESREDQMEAEIARLSSPPEYRADMKMPALLTASFHQSEWCLFTTAGDVVELVEDDEYCSYAESKAMRDTLLGDWASWRNALGVAQDALSERNRKCVELSGKLERAEHEACAQSQRIERLEGALRIAIADIESWHEALDETAGLPPEANVLPRLRQALAAADGQQAAASLAPADRTPEHYAIEHGRYLATAAQLYMDACNALVSAEQELDKAEPDTQGEVDHLISKVERTQETRGERWRALERAIYEFTKRADRAYPLHQPSGTGDGVAGD